MMKVTNIKSQKKQTSWDKLKSDPVKMKHYREWRREYNLRRKGKVVISSNFRKRKAR